MEGLDGRKRARDDPISDLSDLKIGASVAAATPAANSAPKHREAPTRRRAAVWKRILAQDADKKRSIRVVDAVLEDDPKDTTREPMLKRRRLTLIDTDATVVKGSLFVQQSKKKAGYRVLDPVQRLVDDSLQKVHSGELSIAQHILFITGDPSLADQSRRWLVWNHSSQGNLLHACAAWNDVEMTTDLLTRELDGLADAVDEQEHTPYEIAELSGNSQVCEVLEAFGADTSNYVFDIYCLEDEIDTENSMQPESQPNGEATSLELQGGIGYWNEEGQLVLEKSTEAGGDNVDHDEDDEEVDSNDERWDGNDYPDEDGGEWGSSDDEQPIETFRDRAVNFQSTSYYGDDENDDGVFDVSYGISTQPEAEYDSHI